MFESRLTFRYRSKIVRMVSATWFMMMVPFFVDGSMVRKTLPAVLMATRLAYRMIQHNGIYNKFVRYIAYRSYGHTLLFSEKEPCIRGTP